MDEFRQHLQVFRLFQPMSEMDITMEMKKQSSELSSTPLMENFSIADISLESLLAQQVPEFPVSCAQCYSFTATPTADAVRVDEDVLVESKKRKSMEDSNRSDESISPAVSTVEFAGNTNIRKLNRLGKGKKARINAKQPEKAEEEIIHVRARRGQATDSHSLAERVRRGKINEKMRCLQDLVPGCHKAMGMAMMLDEIINYVHSLQNQVEFLSMELAAASSSYALSLESECIKMAQVGTNSHVSQQVEKWARDRYGEQSWFNSTCPL